MVSIIICSINKSNLKDVKVSISKTIGVEHEFVVYDNTVANDGICEVYNKCASKSNGDYICFVHEDVLFETNGWGMNIVGFFKGNPNAGIVGVAGGMYVPKNFISWGDNNICDRWNYWHIDEQGNSRHEKHNPLNEEFSNVVTLDGFFLFVRRGAWEINKFDEKLLKGFHLYDADFCVGVSQAYTNYVAHTIKLLHKSKGSGASKAYYDNLKKFHNKWADKLPIYVSGAESYFTSSRISKEVGNSVFLYKNFKRYYGAVKAALYFILRNSQLVAVLFVCALVKQSALEKIKKLIRVKLRSVLF